MPTIWTLHLQLFVYAHTGGDIKTSPMTVLNPILDAIAAKFLPAQGAAMTIDQTLGGLVERCRIEGKTEIIEGGLGDQAAAIIPITIVVPD